MEEGLPLSLLEGSLSFGRFLAMSSQVRAILLFHKYNGKIPLLLLIYTNDFRKHDIDV